MNSICDHTKQRTGSAFNDEVHLAGRGIDGVELIAPSRKDSEGFVVAPCGDGG